MTPIEIALTISLFALCVWAVFANRELSAVRAWLKAASDELTTTNAIVTRMHRQIAKLRTQVRNLDDDLSAVEGQLETFEPTDEGWQEPDDADAWKYK